MKLKTVIGSGGKIAGFLLPFLVAGIIAGKFYPHLFTIGSPSITLICISIVLLTAGVVNWLWSVILIAVKVPKKELITTGPFSVVKHPLYVGFAFLVLPWLGILLHTWLGVILGIILYIGTRLYARQEEKLLSSAFGKEWDDYCSGVLLPWI